MFHTFVVGAYPVLLIAGGTAAAIPLDLVAVGRALVISFAVTALMLLLLRRIISDDQARTAFLTFFFLAVYLLTPAIAGDSTAPSLAVLCTLIALLVASLIVRPWKTRKRRPGALNVAAALLLAVNIFKSAPAFSSGESWRTAADAVIATAASHRVSPSPMPRDIYHIILDGFGREDVLNQHFQFALRPFIESLHARGFVVPDGTRSNYAQTYLSIGSSLNLNYLDGLAEALRDSSDRRPLDYLIQQNGLMALAKTRGYATFAIGSDYSATTRVSAADVCRCEQYGLSEFDIAAINVTPLRALPLTRWTEGAHRRKVLSALSSLETLVRERGPKLVFAHVVSPHPPFVFGPSGEEQPGRATTFSFADGNHYRESRQTYVSGYRDQIQFLVSRILHVVDVIQKGPGPAPVILIHGDHGPGSMWDWNDVSKSDVRERLAIFMAYRFPDGGDRLPSNVTPIGALRTLSNRYLGTSLPPVEDRSFVSGWKYPYRLNLVDGAQLGPLTQ